jgi:ankyrin repeat protein
MKIIIIYSLLFISCSSNILNSSELPGFNFDNFKDTPLEKLALAVRSENLSKIESIVKNDSVNIDFAEKKYNNTILLCAVVNNKLDATEKLLQLGANINYQTKDEDSINAIVACCEYNSKDTNMLSLLLKYGSDINSKVNSVSGGHTFITTPLLSVLSVSKSKCAFSFFKFMVEKGADINISLNGEQNNLIENSITLDRLDIATYLIKHPQIKLPKYYGYIYTETDHPKLLTIKEALERKDYKEGSENYRLSRLIINYLKSLES